VSDRPAERCHILVRLTGYARVEVLVMDWRREMRGEGNGYVGKETVEESGGGSAAAESYCTKLKYVSKQLIIN
jgi:hypothetical protein